VKQSQAPAAIFHDGLESLGLEVSPETEERILSFLAIVLRINGELNLTRITDPADAVRLHLLDSLSAIPEVSALPTGEMLDLGTGGGFPGVPLAMATERGTVLLDSIAKKTSATTGALEEAGFSGARSVTGRAEEIALDSPAAFAVVVARAVAPLPALVELAAPLLVDGGGLVALKGEPLSEELESGNLVAEMLGMRLVGARGLVLPGGGERRTIISYQKMGPSTVHVPRRIGLAQKRPLA
jgi:16S rRNA (guanine527-N7)-methyltransferase